MNGFRVAAVALALALFWLLLVGCPSAGIYRTAHVLDKGVGDFGMGFSAFRVTQSDYTIKDESGNEETVDGADFAFYNLIPELSYHVGVADDWEVGGRIALGSMLMELDAKYRFYHNGPLHLAVQPALGYESFVVLEGPRVTLPLMLTYDLTDNLSVTAFAYGSYLASPRSTTTPTTT